MKIATKIKLALISGTLVVGALLLLDLDQARQVERELQRLRAISVEQEKAARDAREWLNVLLYALEFPVTTTDWPRAKQFGVMATEGLRASLTRLDVIDRQMNDPNWTESAGELPGADPVAAPRVDLGLTLRKLQSEWTDYAERMDEGLLRQARADRSYVLESQIHDEISPQLDYYLAHVRTQLDAMVDATLAQSSRNLSLKLAGSGLVLVFAIAVGLLLRGSVFRPLRQIERDARAAAGGGGNFQENATRKDELGTVAQALNGMLAAIQANTVTKEELEHTLVERTEKLREQADELRQKGERLELALDASLTSIWDFDNATNRVTLDANWSRMLGGPLETTVTSIRQLFALVHHDDRGRVFRAVLDCRVGIESQYNEEYRVRNLTGDWLWVHSKGRVTGRDPASRAARMIGTNTDVTQRKIAELATQRQLEFLGALNQTTLALLQHRAKAETLDALAVGAATLLDAVQVEVALVEGDELVTHAYGGITAANERGRANRAEAILSWRAMDTRQPVVVENYETLGEGSPYYRSARFRAVAIFPIMLGSHCLGVLGLLRDAAGHSFSTEEQQKGVLLAQLASLVIQNADIYAAARREADERTVALRDREALYRSLVESVNQGYYVADRRSIFTYCNPAMSALGGYGPDDLLGTSCFRLVAPDDRAAVIEKYRQWALDPAITEASCEFKVLTKDGCEFWVEQTTHYQRDSAGQVKEGRNILRDISERKRAETVRDRSLALARATLESTTDGVLVVDAAGRIETYNATFAKMWRVTDEILAQAEDEQAVKTVLDQLKEPEAFMRRLHELYTTPHDNSFDVLHFKDGRVFERYSRPLLVDGQPAGRAWSFRDVTARLLAEAALRDSEIWFKGVFAESPIPIVLLDYPEGRITEINRATTEVFGYTREEVLGRTTLDLGIWVDLDVRNKFLIELQAGREIHAAEIIMRAKDGRLLDILYNASRISIGGRFFVLSSVIDISDRKRAELLFRDLFAFSSDACIIATPRGEIIDINEQTLRLFGYTKEELLGKPWSMLVSDEARPVLVERLNKYFENPVPHPMGASAPGLTAQHRNGRVFPIDISLSPLKSGGELRIVAAVRDITVQKQAETALRQSEAQLRQAQKMESLGTLAGGIAHDFNNILTGILGNSHLALGDIAPEHPAYQWLEGILKSGTRAKNLVQQILTFSRKTETPRSPLRLQPIVTESIGLLRSTLPAMVRIEHTVDPACPPVLADGTQIHQIILNLCTNAWHALPEQGGVIEVNLGCRDLSAVDTAGLATLNPGPHVLLTVRDNGRGMDETVLDRIFEPFFTTKHAGKGTGLGLAVVHSIVTGHGGEILVRSRPGEGTVFEIYLPVFNGTEPAVAPTLNGPAIRGRGEHLLVVDDEPASGNVIARLIERLGYKTTYCPYPQEALKLLETRKFAMLVTDLAMPGLTGDELARRALIDNPLLPVLLISGFVEPGKIETIRALGVKEVLAKPPVYKELAAAIDRCLNV